MKVLVINNGLTVGISGGDVHIIKVTQYWAKTNTIFFLIPRRAYLASKLLVGKSLVYGTPFKLDYYTKVFGTLGSAILFTLRILKTVLFNPKERFDAIIASSHYPHDVIPAIVFHLRNPKSKLVVYLHGISIPSDNMLRSLISTMYNIFGLLLCARGARLIFVINSPTRKYLLHQGVEGGRVVVTTNGVETEEVVGLRKRKIFDACFMGRLVKSKGIFDLPSIWKRVCSIRPSATLAILGGGPEKELINKLVVKTGLKKNIILFGFVTEDKKYNLLKSSKIFIFPSYLESWGISIAEAMACGLPVVAYDLPIYKEVFNDKLLTVPLGDVDAMAKQVIYLLENPEVTRKIGEANREFVKKYDWGIVAKRELKAIEMIVHPSIRVKEANAYALNLDMSATK